MAEQTNNRGKQPLYVVSVEAVRKQTLWGYQREKERPFLKVTMVLPTMVTTARTILEKARRKPRIRPHPRTASLSLHALLPPADRPPS